MKRLLIINPHLRQGGVERVISLLSLHAPMGWRVSLALWDKVIDYPLNRALESISYIPIVDLLTSLRVL